MLVKTLRVGMGCIYLRYYNNLSFHSFHLSLKKCFDSILLLMPPYVRIKSLIYL